MSYCSLILSEILQLYSKILKVWHFAFHWALLWDIRLFSFELGLPFCEEKKIPRNTEQMEILTHSVEILSVPRSGNARNSVPIIPRKIKKKLGIPFRTISAEDKKARNSVLNHFAKEKTLWTRNLVPKLSGEHKDAWNWGRRMQTRSCEGSKLLSKPCFCHFKSIIV